MILLIALVALAKVPDVIQVNDSDAFAVALRKAKPGAVIALTSGEFRGGVQISNVHGQPKRPIRIVAADPKKPPVFVGGGSGLQLSKVSHLVIDGLHFRGATGNGLNIDDGGDYEVPSHDVTVRRVVVTDLPRGNHDGIKLSGLDRFVVEDCRIERWGGSAVDMVGCHDGTIRTCLFRDGGDSSVQMKGGTQGVAVEACRFEQFGQRGVNLGGSTGLEYFRPPVAKMQKGERYEAKDLKVQGCVFVGGGSPVAFVGVDGAQVVHNTLVNPGRWAVRILQETRSDGFVPSRRGVFTDNLIVYSSQDWASGGFNVGDATDPLSFVVKHNFWYCHDQPSRTQVASPVPEEGGLYGVDPLLKPDGTVSQGSPAQEFGAHSFKPKA